MSDSIYGIRGVSPFAATLQGRKQPRERQAPPARTDSDRSGDERDEQPVPSGGPANRLDVKV